MTTSFFSNNHNSLSCKTWPGLALRLATILLLAAALPAGCSSDSGSDPCDIDELPLIDGIPDEALSVSQASLEARASYAADGTRTNTNLVRLTASDRSLGSIQSREPAACCGVTTCFLLTGNPVPVCREPSSGAACGAGPACQSGQTCVEDACVRCVSGPLRIKAASIDGLAGNDGAIDLDAVGDNGDKWTKGGLDTPLFDPSKTLTLQVEGDTADGFLPSYSQTLESPEPLEMIEPDPTASPQLPGQIDLKVKWKPGNGHWVEAVIRVDDPGGAVSDAAICLAHDDGCMVVPAGAIDTIMEGAPADAKLDLSVRRVISKTEQPSADDADTVVQFKAVERVDMLLAQ